MPALGRVIRVIFAMRPFALAGGKAYQGVKSSLGEDRPISLRAR